MTTSSQKVSLSAMDYVLVTVGEVATSTASEGVVLNRALSMFGTVALSGGNLSTNSRDGGRDAPVLTTDASTRRRVYSVQVGTASNDLPGSWLQDGANATGGAIDLHAGVSVSDPGSAVKGHLTTTAGNVGNGYGYGVNVQRQGVAIASAVQLSGAVNMVSLGANHAVYRA